MLPSRPHARLAPLSGWPPKPPADESERTPERPLIWIVDDSPLEVEMARRVLAERYRVEVFVDGATMLERCANGHRPYALVLDCQLPGMSGGEVCRFLRATMDEVALPVIMLTVQGHKQDVVEGLAAGANDYVTKPYDAGELLARVGTLVRTKQLYERADRAERACLVERARLVHSEQRLRMLAESIPQIVWTATPEGTVDFTNRRWMELTGLSLCDTQLDGWYSAVHEDDREGCRTSWARSVATGEIYDLQLRLRSAVDGEHRWYLGRAVPLRDAEGHITKWFGTFTDIDDQKRTEAQIDAVLEGSPVGIGFLDRGLRFLRVNEALAAADGTPREGHVGRPLREVLPQEGPAVEALFRQVLDTGEPLTNQEITLRAPDEAKGERHFLASYFPVRVSDQTVGLAMMTMDITERKRAERAVDLLARAGAELVASLDAAAPCELITRLVVPSLADVAGIYLCEHDDALALLAGSPEETKAATVLRDLAPFVRPLLTAASSPSAPRVPGRAELVPDVQAALRGSGAVGAGEAGEAGALDRLRDAGLTSCILAPLSMQGQTCGYLALVMAGSRRRHEPADVALTEELAGRAAVAVEKARLFEMMQKERARVEEANQSKDEFLAVVSHELRAPLTAILGWSSLLLEGRLRPEVREEALRTIERNARSQTQLIADLLDVSSIMSGKLHLAIGLVEPAAIAKSAVDTIRPSAAAKGVALLPDIDPGAGTICGDGGRLQQIVVNLLTNAVKFTPAGGVVEVRVRRRDTDVEITVSDTGRGIAAGFLPHVFERFRQADGSITRAHGGLGLGLAITRHLVDLHGGTIQASSPGEGRGATFVVRLPLAPPGASTADAPAASAPRDLPPSLRCPPELRGLSVLVVEDEQDVLAFVSAVLAAAEARVTAVTSAADALEAIRAAPPAMMVSDVGMPGESGYDLIRKLRRLPPEEGGRTPALALTGYARLEDRTRALMMGFDMHLAKPIDPSELLATLALLANRSRPR